MLSMYITLHNRREENRREEKRTEENRREQKRTEENRTEQNVTEENETKHDKAAPTEGCLFIFSRGHTHSLKEDVVHIL